MKLSFERFGSFGFNRRPLTEADFYRICKKYRIIVEEHSVSNSFYMTCLGRHIIVIGKNLKGIRRLYAMFHELGHFFLHAGVSEEEAFYFGHHKTKEEVEADVFATICLIPWNRIDDDSFLDIYPRSFAKQVYQDRQRIAFLYRI